MRHLSPLALLTAAYLHLQTRRRTPELWRLGQDSAFLLTSVTTAFSLVGIPLAANVHYPSLVEGPNYTSTNKHDSISTRPGVHTSCLPCCSCAEEKQKYHIRVRIGLIHPTRTHPTHTPTHYRHRSSGVLACTQPPNSVRWMDRYIDRCCCFAATFQHKHPKLHNADSSS